MLRIKVPLSNNFLSASCVFSSLENGCTDFYKINCDLASRRWGPEFASRSLHVGFVVDETKSRKVFFGVSPVFPCQKFHLIISPHSSHSFRYLFISQARVMVHQAWPLLITDHQYRASSHLILLPELYVRYL